MIKFKIVFFCLIFTSFFTIKANSKDDLYNEYQYAFIEANRQEILGSVVESAKLLHTYLQQYPENANVLYKLSKIYASVGSFQESLVYAEKAFKFDKDNEWITYNLLQLYLLKNDKKAANNLVNYIRKQEKIVNLLQLGIIEYYLQYNDVKSALRFIETIKAKSTEVVFLEAECYSLLNEPEKAIKVLKSEVVQVFALPQSIGIMAEIYTQKNDYVKAKQLYKELFYLEPGNRIFWMSYFEFLVEENDFSKIDSFATVILMDSYVDMDDKIFVFNSLHNKDSVIFSNSIKNGIDYLSSIHLNWDEESLLLKNYIYANINRKDASSYLKSIKQYNISNPDFWQNLLFTIGINNTDSVSDYAKEAYLKFTNEPLFIWFYAYTLKNRKDYHEALSLLQDVNIEKIKNEKLKLEYFITIGSILELIENYDDAYRNYEKALIIDPENLMLLNNYSYSLSVQNKKLDYALKLIKTCIESDNNNFIYLDTYAWVLFKLNRFKEAKKIIEKALNKGGSEHSEILFHYGEILVELNMYKDALKYYNYALQYCNDEALLEKINNGKSLIDNSK